MTSIRLDAQELIFVHHNDIIHALSSQSIYCRGIIYLSRFALRLLIINSHESNETELGRTGNKSARFEEGGHASTIFFLYLKG